MGSVDLDEAMCGESKVEPVMEEPDDPQDEFDREFYQFIGEIELELDNLTSTILAELEEVGLLHGG